MKLYAYLGAAAVGLTLGLAIGPASALEWPVVYDDAFKAKSKASAKPTRVSDVETPAERKLDITPSNAAKAPVAAAEGGVKTVKEAVPAAEADAGAESEVVEAAKPPPPPPVTLKIAINLTSQRLTVTENGKVRFTWKISSGRSGYLTPTGNYRPQWMARKWRSRKYGNAPMPHSIFFHRGYAIHATYATGRLGRPASHGCIRLSPRNARTLFRLVSRHGKAATRITIRGHAKQYRQRYVKKRRPRRYYRPVPPGYMYSYRRPPRQAYRMKPRRYRKVYRTY